MVDLCRSVEAAMSDALQAVLSQLDQWRHLPKYRLEQHVDVLFGMTLPKVLSSRFGIPVDDLQVIPEFPIRYGTLASRYQGKAKDDQSFNVDFSVWSKSRERVFLVELKTDAGSLDVKQLAASTSATMPTSSTALVPWNERPPRIRIISARSAARREESI